MYTKIQIEFYLVNRKKEHTIEIITRIWRKYIMKEIETLKYISKSEGKIEMTIKNIPLLFNININKYSISIYYSFIDISFSCQYYYYGIFNIKM